MKQIKTQEEFSFLADEYVHRQESLNGLDLGLYTYLLYKVRKGEQITLPELRKHWDEDENTILQRIDRLRDCNLIEPQDLPGLT